MGIKKIQEIIIWC